MLITSKLESTTPALAVWNNRQTIIESRDRLKSLCEAVDWQNDLALSQWVQWYAMALQFQPDLIVELGRGKGNSTCLFTEAANHLQNCRVVSLCLSPDWEEVTKPRVEKIVPPQWFQCLEIRRENILKTDIEALFGDSQRILVLWDAHGYDIANFVLGCMMPLLRQRKHCVIMHDISDTRYTSFQGDYKGKGLWRGNNDGSTRLNIGYFDSAVEQAVSIVDFTSRNKLALNSADHSFYTELNDEQIRELQETLGKEFFSKNGHWFWFSLNEKNEDEPIYFPNFSSEPTEWERLQAELERLQTELAQSHVQLQQTHSQLQQTLGVVERLQGIIRAMESTKFWKLRTVWLRLKQTIGLTKAD